MQLRLGIIGKPHGLRGEVTIFPTTDEPEIRFTSGAEVIVGAGGGIDEIASARNQSGTWLIRLASSNNRNDAEALRGVELFHEIDDEEVLADDEYFDYTLVGREVRRHDGSVVGKVTDVQHLPAQDCLVVKTAAGDRLVPFVAALVPVVTDEYLQLADVAGLVDDDE